MDKKEAKEWFGVAPRPQRDRAVAQFRRGSGADWIIRTRCSMRFPRARRGGTISLYANVGMPNVMWQLSGSKQLHDEVFGGARVRGESGAARTKAWCSRRDARK